VPRKADYHPLAIPAPYYHSNIDSDEVLYYFDPNQLVTPVADPAENVGAISFHPSGLPHGPQPGGYEASLGVVDNNNVFIMMDTFRPLTLTAAARAMDDPAYMASWVEAPVA
jgi:homogentisate 1,2-dioxygenase